MISLFILAATAVVITIGAIFETRKADAEMARSQEEAKRQMEAKIMRRLEEEQQRQDNQRIQASSPFKSSDPRKRQEYLEQVFLDFDKY